MSVRDYSSKGSAFREIGDFIAHPELKDRGIVLKDITSLRPNFEELLLNERKGISVDYGALPQFNGIGGCTKIKNELESTFVDAGLPISINETDANFREFVFCTIFLLGQFSMKIDDQKSGFIIEYSKDLSLSSRVESSQIPNFFVLFPLLTIRNCWRAYPGTILTPSSTKLSGYVARRFDTGHIAAIPNENEPGGGILKGSDFKVGEVWPLDA